MKLYEERPRTGLSSSQSRNVRKREERKEPPWSTRPESQPAPSGPSRTTIPNPRPFSALTAMGPQPPTPLESFKRHGDRNDHERSRAQKDPLREEGVDARGLAKQFQRLSMEDGSRLPAPYYEQPQNPPYFERVRLPERPIEVERAPDQPSAPSYRTRSDGDPHYYRVKKTKDSAYFYSAISGC